MNTSKYSTELVDTIQRFIAGTCIDASVLRNQGKGVATEIASYLENRTDLLAEMVARDLNGFAQWLDEQTRAILDSLAARLELQQEPWGTVRKAINIFLRCALYNHFLRSRYDLERFETLFEIPLDSHVASALQKQPEGACLPAWPGLKYLTQEHSALFQACADAVVKRRNLPARVYLDHEFWTNGSNQR